CALREGWPEGSGPFCKIAYYPNAYVKEAGGYRRLADMPCSQQPLGDVCKGELCRSDFAERAGYYCSWAGMIVSGDFCLQVVIGGEPEQTPCPPGYGSETGTCLPYPDKTIERACMAGGGDTFVQCMHDAGQPGY